MISRFHLTAEAQQKAHAIEFGRNPTCPVLYEDDEVLAVQQLEGELSRLARRGW
ncbi:MULTISPECIES: hypothetical protein [Halomonadaceae]|uniref:hypothetical protein n=1 Tax=Halomonadaceae TaxID=28256 RepID=UPI00030D299F|nr:MULTISPECIES: hypothetical protein [Halomonas]